MADDIEPVIDGEIVPLRSQQPQFLAPRHIRTRDEAAVYEQGRVRAAEIAVRWQLQGQASRAQAEHAKDTHKTLLDTGKAFVDDFTAADPEVRRQTGAACENLKRLHQAGQLGYYQTTMLGTDEVLGREFLPAKPPTFWDWLSGSD